MRGKWRIKIMTKSFFRKVFFVVLVVAFLNCCFLCIQYIKPMKEMKEYKNVANINEYTKGNCVLIRKTNGIRTFPFVFGERLYI